MTRNQGIPALNSTVESSVNLGEKIQLDFYLEFLTLERFRRVVPWGLVNCSLSFSLINLNLNPGVKFVVEREGQ